MGIETAEAHYMGSYETMTVSQEGRNIMSNEMGRIFHIQAVSFSIFPLPTWGICESKVKENWYIP